MAKSISEIIDLIVDKILTGGRRTSAQNVREVLTETANSYLNVKDGGNVIEQLAGYATDLTPTDNKHLATKKYVDENGGSVADASETVAGKSRLATDAEFNTNTPSDITSYSPPASSNVSLTLRTLGQLWVKIQTKFSNVYTKAESDGRYLLSIITGGIGYFSENNVISQNGTGIVRVPEVGQALVFSDGGPTTLLLTQTYMYTSGYQKSDLLIVENRRTSGNVTVTADEVYVLFRQTGPQNFTLEPGQFCILYRWSTNAYLGYTPFGPFALSDRFNLDQSKLKAQLINFAALPANTLSVDGQTITGDTNGNIGVIDTFAPLSVNQRIVVNGEADKKKNGIFRVVNPGDGSQPFVLVRTEDANNSDKIANATVVIEGGSNQNKTFRQKNGLVALGVGNVEFEEVVFGSGGPSNTDGLPEGSTNLYFTTARVLATALSGLNTALTGAVVSTDTILQGFCKVQYNLTQIYALLAGNLTSIAGLSTVANKLTYWTGAGTAALTDLTAFARGLISLTTENQVRSYLGLENSRLISNANATITQVDKVVGTTTTALTASRTFTLPAISTMLPGQEIIIADCGGAINGTNYLIISRAGSDTINGVTSETIMSAYGMRRLFADTANNRWNFDKGVLRAGNNLSDVSSISIAKANLQVLEMPENNGIFTNGASGGTYTLAANILHVSPIYTSGKKIGKAILSNITTLPTNPTKCSWVLYEFNPVTLALTVVSQLGEMTITATGAQTLTFTQIQLVKGKQYMFGYIFDNGLSLARITASANPLVKTNYGNTGTVSTPTCGCTSALAYTTTLPASTFNEGGTNQTLILWDQIT